MGKQESFEWYEALDYQETVGSNPTPVTNILILNNMTVGESKLDEFPIGWHVAKRINTYNINVFTCVDRIGINLISGIILEKKLRFGTVLLKLRLDIPLPTGETEGWFSYFDSNYTDPPFNEVKHHFIKTI